MSKINKLNQYLLYSYPITLIFSTALSNVIVAYISVIGIFFSLKRTHFFNNKYIIFFITFCFFISINSILLHPNSLSLKSSILLIRYLFFVFGFYYILSSTKFNLSNFFFIYLFLLIVLFFDSNYQTINNGVNIVGFDSYKYQVFRISSFFKEELILGSYVQKFSILCICFFHFLDKEKFKFLNALVLIISLQVCLISGERTAFISLLLFSIIYFLLFFNISKIRKIIFFLVVIILGSITIKFNNNVQSRILVFKQDLQSANYKYFSSGHKKHFINAFNFFKDRPISGYGSNNFRKFCKKYDQILNINGCSTHPHNLIAQFIAEKGVIGILYMLIFYLFLTYRIFLCLIDLNSKNEKVALSIFAILIFFNPFFPSANFYNSWVNNIIVMIFLIIFNLKEKNDL